MYAKHEHLFTETNYVAQIDSLIRIINNIRWKNMLSKHKTLDIMATLKLPLKTVNANTKMHCEMGKQNRLRFDNHHHLILAVCFSFMHVKCPPAPFRVQDSKIMHLMAINWLADFIWILRTMWLTANECSKCMCFAERASTWC